MNYFLTPAFALPENISFSRIGIIPYFRDSECHRSDLNFFLMLDAKFNELTDCGGLPKKEESWIDTAIRETEEESRGKFFFTREQLLNEGHIFWREDHRIAIIFININYRVPTKLHAADMCYRYRLDYLKGLMSKDKRHLLENSEMFFYDINELLLVAKQGGRIYTPVRMLLLKLIYNHHIDHLK